MSKGINFYRKPIKIIRTELHTPHFIFNYLFYKVYYNDILFYHYSQHLLYGIMLHSDQIKKPLKYQNMWNRIFHP